MPLYVAIPVIIVAVIITALVAWNVAISYRKKVVESKIGTLRRRPVRLLMRP